jgi:hypothetical protein
MSLLHFQFLILFWGNLLSLHPLHISVTEIQMDEKEKELEITMRVFTDDLETALRQALNQPELDILEPKNGLTVDQMMETYLKKHFNVKLDDKLQVAKLIGHEQDADAFIFYIGISNVKKWKTISVLNSALTASFEDQSNLVHVTVRDETKSLRLTRDTPADKLTFDLK